MSHQLRLIHNDGTESQWPGIPTSRHPQSPERKSAETRFSRRSDMLIFDVDVLLLTRLRSAFPCHKVIYIVQPKHIRSPSVKMQRSLWTFNNLASQLSTTITLNARSSTFLGLYLLLTLEIHRNSLHSTRAPWIHQKPHLGGSVHPMLFEAPNESFDPPNGQGKDRSFDRRSFPGPNCSCTVSWSRCTSCKAEKMMILSLLC